MTDSPFRNQQFNLLHPGHWKVKMSVCPQIDTLVEVVGLDTGPGQLHSQSIVLIEKLLLIDEVFEAMSGE